MLSRKNFWSIVFVLALSSPVGNVWALTSPGDVSGLDCDVQPTCESLNYSKTADPDCEVGGYVYCPFDSSYMKCVLKKPKIDDVCEGFKLAECPENANCYTCESETATKYTFESCKEGFTHLNNLCVAIHDTCEGAGYRTTNEGGFCKSTAMITISDGTEKTCYADCCTYLAQETCEQANPNSKCTADEIGCFVASACKTGFYKEANDVTCAGAQYTTIGGADANGCGYCATEFTTCEEAGYYTTTSAANAACAAAAPEPWPVYMADGQVGACVSCGFAWCEENEKSKTRCEEVYANSVCSPNSSGCFKPTACKVGFYADKAGCGQDLGLAMANATLVKLDGNGCGECQFIEKTCAELSNDMHGVNDLDGLVCASSANINLAGVYSTCHYDCEVKISCQYYDEASCVSENGNSICTESSDGCWGATACKVGFYTEANDINCPRGDYSKIGGVDANGCGFCATEYESCKAAGFADEPIANGVEHPMYLADGSFERFCMAPATKEACEDAFFNSKCVETEEGEWKADGCQKESATSCPGMSYTDMAGCRTCTLGYENKETCEGANANSVCTEQSDGTFEPTACETGFSNECSTRVNADKNGCGVCCDFGSETICEKQNANADCTQQNGACWQVTGCADKYKLENGACVASQTCEDFGFLTSDATCSTTAEPKNVTLVNGTTITCVTCGVGCDYSSKYDCETKNANAICEINDKLCPVVDGCKTGYALMSGVCQKTYDGINACENANPGAVCEFVGDGGYSNGSYAPTGECKEGYSLKDGACVANCEYADERECETTNFNSDCTQVDGCFVPTACNPARLNEFDPNDLSKCMMGGRYHATKLINIDPYGCGSCATDFDTCDQLGYVELPHASGGEALGAGREFLFLSSRGYPVDCWILDGTCAYDTLEDCQANASACKSNMGCYEATSCPDGYTLTEGACVRDVITYSSLEACELANLVWNCAQDASGNYVPTTCKGRTGNGSQCYLDSDQGDCVSENYVKDCIAVDGGFIPSECIYSTKKACEDDNIYSEYCIQETKSNCWKPDAVCKKVTQIAVDEGKAGQILDHDNNRFGCFIYLSNTKELCESLYSGFNCEYQKGAYVEGGYLPTTCKSGYTLSADGKCVSSNPCANIGLGEGWYPSETCASTCNGSCISGNPVKYYNASSSGVSLKACLKCCTYSDQIACEEANSGFACEVDAHGACYAPTTSCKDGYKLENGKCVLDVITYGSITECEAANPGFVCDYYGGGYGDASKWVSTGTCKSNYKLENGACVPQTCDEGTYSSKEECEEKYPGFECGEVGDDSSLGSGAQGHSGGN